LVSYRQQRVSELLREELGLLIQAEVDDPRLEDALVTVTHVDVTPDLLNARVYIDHALPAESARPILEALRHAEPYLRRALAESLDLRAVPMLTFHVDTVEQRARRVDSILDQIAAGDRAQSQDAHDDAG
jgi:ribosome-binding factor A